MGWIDFDERARVFKATGVQCEYLCDLPDCGKPISYGELPVIDPKGGYYPKPEGAASMLTAPRPKRTFHIRCDQIRRGKRPKEDLNPKEEKKSKKESRKEEVQNNGHASKKLIRLGERVLETIRKKPKKEWSVWEVILALRDQEKQKDIRAACNYLKAEGLLVRKNGVLVPKSKKS